MFVSAKRKWRLGPGQNQRLASFVSSSFLVFFMLFSCNVQYKTLADMPVAVKVFYGFLMSGRQLTGGGYFAKMKNRFVLCKLKPQPNLRRKLCVSALKSVHRF